MSNVNWSALAAMKAAGMTQADVETLAGANPPPTSNANTVGQDAISLVQQQYPSLAWMLNIPGLSETIISAAQQGLASTDVQAAIQNTQWWQTQSTQAKSFFAEEMSGNIVDAQNQFQAQLSAMQQTFGQLGINPTQNQLQIFAWQSLVNNWTPAQALQMVGQYMRVNSDGSIVMQSDMGQQVLQTGTNNLGQTEILGVGKPSGQVDWAALAAMKAAGLTQAQVEALGQQGIATPQSSNGQAQSLQQNLEALAKQYLVNMTPAQIGQWVVSAVTQGETAAQAQQGFQAYLQTTAIAQYPWMEQGIKSGQTPLTLASPYANMLASELGISPNNIDFTQPQYAKLLSTPDPKTGNPMQNPIWQATQQVRSDPQYGWDKTPNGLSAQYSLVQGLQETMGLRSYGGLSPGNISMPQSYGSSGG